MTGPRSGGLQEERRVQRNLREEEDAHLPRTPHQKIVEGRVVEKRLILIRLIKTLKAQCAAEKNVVV